MGQTTKVECPNGHVYAWREEAPEWWPDGAPLCPVCCKTWIYTHPNWSYIKKLKTMARIKSRLEETYVGHKKRLELRILPDMSERQGRDQGTKDSKSEENS